MAKIHRVLVSWTTSGNMYIESRNSEDTRNIALELLEAGRGEIIEIDEADGYKIDDVQEANKPEDAEIKNASENIAELKEVQEDKE